MTTITHWSEAEEKSLITAVSGNVKPSSQGGFYVDCESTISRSSRAHVHAKHLALIARTRSCDARFVH